MRKMIAATILTAGLAVAPTLDAVHAQDATTEEEGDDNGKVGALRARRPPRLAGLA